MELCEGCGSGYLPLSTGAMGLCEDCANKEVATIRAENKRLKRALAAYAAAGDIYIHDVGIVISGHPLWRPDIEKFQNALFEARRLREGGEDEVSELQKEG